MDLLLTDEEIKTELRKTKPEDLIENYGIFDYKRIAQAQLAKALKGKEAEIDHLKAERGKMVNPYYQTVDRGGVPWNKYPEFSVYEQALDDFLAKIGE